MTRKELARELRTIADARKVLGITLNAKHIGTQDDHVLEVLLEAAAALEEEERDARRYGLLKEAVIQRFSSSKSWCVRHGPSDKAYLMAHSEPMDEDQDMPEGKWGWYSTLDAALDAWLEERGKEDRDSGGG